MLWALSPALTSSASDPMLVVLEGRWARLTPRSRSEELLLWVMTRTPRASMKESTSCARPWHPGQGASGTVSLHACMLRVIGLARDPGPPARTHLECPCLIALLLPLVLALAPLDSVRLPLGLRFAGFYLLGQLSFGLGCACMHACMQAVSMRVQVVNALNAVHACTHATDARSDVAAQPPSFPPSLPSPQVRKLWDHHRHTALLGC
jgi:hypothetical protein